jgi:hypothetical protein
MMGADQRFPFFSQVLLDLPFALSDVAKLPQQIPERRDPLRFFYSFLLIKRVNIFWLQT